MFEVADRLPGDRYRCAFYFLKARGTVGSRLLGRGHLVQEQLQGGRYDPTVTFKLAHRLRQFSPDILFLLDHHNAILWGGLAGVLGGVKKRVVASHATRRMGGRPSFNGVDRWVVRTASAVVALSDSHAAYLRDSEGIPGSKLVVIENGIDCERYANVDGKEAALERTRLGIGGEDRVVLMVAALRPEKAHESLLAAAAALVTSPDSWKFLVVGDGELREALESKAGEMGLGAQVLFLGERADIPVLLALSDVLVLPSHDAVETLPLAVLEAMAAGVPVVASSVGSLPDVLENDVNGKLITPADADGLARAVRDIITDRTKSARMTDNARETVRERYGVGRMVARYQALFEGLLET